MFKSGHMQWGGSARHRRVDCRPSRDQPTHHRLVAVLRGKIHCGTSIVKAPTHRGRGHNDQPTSHTAIATIADGHSRTAIRSIAVGNPRLTAKCWGLCDQPTHHHIVAALRGHKQLLLLLAPLLLRCLV